MLAETESCVRNNSGSLAIFTAPSLTEKPEDPLSNVDPPASMSRNEMESSWGKCEADMIRGPLATRRLSLSSHFESSQFPRLTAARAASRYTSLSFRHESSGRTSLRRLLPG